MYHSLRRRIMYKIEYIEHSADIGFHIKSDSIEELFKGALIELSNNLVELKKINQVLEKKELNVKGKDHNELLFNVLKTSLDQFYSDNYIPVKIVSIDITQNNVNLKTEGYILDQIHSNLLKYEIKSITYHQLDIKYKDEEYSTRIILDV